jgi:sugar phosphate isomerase/epimerase
MYNGVMWGSFCRHEELDVTGGPEDRIRMAADYGMDCYQLGAGRDVDLEDKGDLRRKKALLDELEMACCLSAGLVGPALEGDDSAIRRVFEAARALDALCINSHFSPGMNTRWKEGWTPEDAERYIAADTAAVQALAPYAEEYGVRLAFENHLDYLFAEVCAILDAVDSPWVGLMFDTGNPLLFLQDPMRYAEHFAGRIFSLHFKDAYVLDHPDGARIVWCAAGEGIVDLPGVLAVLDEHDPDAVLTLEFWAQAAHEVPYETEEYWRHLLTDRQDAHPMLERIQRDLKRGRPEPGTTDEEGLREERHAMQEFPNYVRRTLDALRR